MKIGLSVPVMGPGSTPENLRAVARLAEEAELSTLWVADRLLYPVDPRTPYPPAPDGKLPAEARRSLDPLQTLGFLAGLTEKVRLGTAVLNIPFYQPVLLARRLATLDILSQGRLTVGLGLGWSEDEFEAVGARLGGRGRRAEESLAVLKALWGPDPVSAEGATFRVAPSVMEAKPVQKPHPPIYMAAYAPAALDRVARLADGWLPIGFTLPALAGTWKNLKAHAGDRPLDLIAGAFPQFTSRALDEPRPLLVGDEGQLRADLAALESMGASEVFLVARGDAGESRRLIERIKLL